MLPATGRQHRGCIAHSLVLSSAPEDGQNNFPKHVELTGIINKLLLLHPVGCLCYLFQWCTVKQISDNEIYLLMKYIKSVLWRVAKCLSYIEEARRLKVNHYLIKGTIFEKKKLLNIKFVLTFCTTLVWNILILRRMERNVIINVHRSSCEVPGILVTWIFWDRFSKSIQIKKLMKILPMVADLFHVGERTDRQTNRYNGANSGFSQFCEGAWRTLIEEMISCKKLVSDFY